MNDSFLGKTPYKNLCEEHQELTILYRDVIGLIAKGEDVVGEQVIEFQQGFGHKQFFLTHVFYVDKFVLDLVTDGKKKPIEYDHIEYLAEALEIDTANALQVVKYSAVHEAAHMLESEFGGVWSSDHEEDFETILIGLLDKYWSVL